MPEFIKTSSDVGTEDKVEFDKNSWYYDMSGNKFVIILNHHVFEKSRHYGNWPSTKEATMKDEERIIEVFKALGFKIKTQNDLTYQQIIDNLTEFASSDHSRTSCICVVILSHGTEGGMVCAADRFYPLSQVINIFSKKSLAHKPKIFIVQACRGTKVDPGYCLDSDSSGPAHSLVSTFLMKAATLFSSSIKALGDMVPYDTDSYQTRTSSLVQQQLTDAETFVIYSSVEGFRSYCDNERGSPMIQELCNAIDKFSEDMHFAEIVTIMQRVVADYREKQMPVITDTATKFLKFQIHNSDISRTHTKDMSPESVDRYKDIEIALSRFEWPHDKYVNLSKDPSKIKIYSKHRSATVCH